MQQTNKDVITIIMTIILAVIPHSAFSKTFKWVDEQGVTHYGDRIPPEYKDRGNSELDPRGVVIKKTDPTLTPEQRKAREEEAARKKIEEQKAEEQKRQDIALLNTYTSPEEIDAKRDRDLQYVSLSMGNAQTSLNSIQDQLKSLQKRADSFTQAKKPVPEHLKTDIANAASEKQKLEDLIARKRQQLAEITAKYQQYRQRFIELTNLNKPTATRTAH